MNWRLIVVLVVLCLLVGATAVYVPLRRQVVTYRGQVAVLQGRAQVLVEILARRQRFTVHFGSAPAGVTPPVAVEAAPEPPLGPIPWAMTLPPETPDAPSPAPPPAPARVFPTSQGGGHLLPWIGYRPAAGAMAGLGIVTDKWAAGAGYSHEGQWAAWWGWRFRLFGVW